MSIGRQLNLGLIVLGLGVVAGTVTVGLGAAEGAGNASTLLAATAGIVLGGGIWHYIAVHHERREQASARRFLDHLAQHVETDGAAVGLSSLPPIDQKSPWAKPLQHMFDCLSAIHDRRLMLESARAASEIRMQRIAAELEMMQSILSKLGEPVVTVNAYDEIQYANRDAESMFHLKPAGQEKRRFSSIVGCDKLASMIADVRRRSVATERSDDFELKDADGELRWYRATVGNLPSDGNRDDEGGAVLVLRDVTAHRVMQKQHAEFVSSASHEMKAPLAGIKAYVELLADGDAEDDAAREEFLGVINGQADRLQRLIDNLLNIARIEAGVVRVSKQSRSVNEILNEAAHVVQPSAEAKQITLAADLSPLYLGALVDRDMLLQAAINLLSNAVKYTPAGGRVTLRSRLADQEIQIEVEDTGVGLAADDCDKVFDKFYRVDKDKTMAPGTGLGLPLAKHIVEDVHGGRLSVRSQLGVGSTFTISIPHVGKSS